MGVRDLVTGLEQSVIRYAAQLGITAAARREAPGVYVQGSKLASVGIRIRRGASYHGLALNVNMDLEPFGRINPCGHAGLAMTQLADLASGVRGELRQRPAWNRICGRPWGLRHVTAFVTASRLTSSRARA